MRACRVEQTGPGLWRYNLQQLVPIIPVQLPLSDALLLVVGVAGFQQLAEQIYRTLLTGPSVRPSVPVQW